MLQTHFRTCHLCEAMCGLALSVENGRVTAIRGDAADPFSQGHICPKALALTDIHEDPDRLRQPLRRTGTTWETMGWEEALDEAAARLQEVQARYGPDAVGVYLGNPNVHSLGSMLFNGVLLRALRTRNRFSATSVDQLPHHLAARHMFGHQLLLPIPDVDRSDYMLILGANPLVSNGSLMTAGGIERRLKGLQARGGKVVVIDPRRTATARLADEHHFIRPGSDVLFLLGVAHTLLAEGLARPGRLADFSEGSAELEAALAPYTPERVAPPTGIEAATIRRLARELAAAPAAACYGRMGVSTQTFGGLCQWLINGVNWLTGNLDRPGGVMFTTPAVDIVDERRAGQFGRYRSRVRGLPEFAGELPAAALAEEIATPGSGQIRALVTLGGNPVLSTPNGAALDEALAGLAYMVSIDIYRNETTRHAHLILPPTTGLETSHYDLIFHVLAVRNTARYSPALFEPAAGARHDWQIFRGLAQRMGALDPSHPMSQLTPEQALDFGLQTGPYGGQGLSLAQLQAQPHGIDWGPLQPRLPERLFTADKRIKLAPAPFLADLGRVEATFWGATDDAAGYELRLIGRRDLRSNNSWMHNSPRLMRGKTRCTLWMHSADADARGLHDGQMVRLASRSGQIELPLEVTDDIMPGVVSAPHGWGHDRAGVALAVAQAQPGASLNDVTDAARLDALSGNAALNGTPVRVSAAVA